MWPGPRGDEEKEVSNRLEIGWKAMNCSLNEACTRSTGETEVSQKIQTVSSFVQPRLHNMRIPLTVYKRLCFAGLFILESHWFVVVFEVAEPSRSAVDKCWLIHRDVSLTLEGITDPLSCI